MVEYDSTILPGREGKLTQEVNLKNMKGPVRKSVTVSSNASNTPELQLTLEATIEEIIEVSTRHLRIAGSAEEITLVTDKKDLAVLSVEFKSKSAAGKPEWQADLPLALEFELTPTDSAGTVKACYRLKIIPSDAAKSAGYGEFSVTTNHPEKRELTLHGSIEAAK